MEVTINKTTGSYLSHARVSATGGPGILVDHAGNLDDARPGDLLQTATRLLVVLQSWPDRNTYHSFSTAWCLALDSLAAIRRSGEPIAEGLKVAVIGSDQALTREINKAAPISSPVGRQVQAGKLLQELKPLIEQDAPELHKAIEQHLADQAAGFRIILPAGSGVAIGDEISLAVGRVTVQAIDRKTWPGLELLVCSDPQAVGLVKRIRRCAGGAA